MALLCDVPDIQNLRKINVLIVDKNGILTEALFMFNCMVLTLGVYVDKLALAQWLRVQGLAIARNDTNDGLALVKAHLSIAEGKWYRRRNKLRSVRVN